MQGTQLRRMCRLPELLAEPALVCRPMVQPVRPSWLACMEIGVPHGAADDAMDHFGAKPA
jgi:hypothetical protein